MNRRKIKPTHVERALYGDGSMVSLQNVVDEPGSGKFGALSYWEHTQPLLRDRTYSQGEKIHVAAFQCHEAAQIVEKGARNLSITHAIEPFSLPPFTPRLALAVRGSAKASCATSAVEIVPV
ncbi:Arylacetonitrilase [Colletotrichum orbiculare MAFF 240422]|uniref:Arylacetonitrilase n=1 Tax=Colletotrichum orbiculare (strain 104-T / ATCC 96160 / CBS 514.97 / LARS 414 / MAFF 240422) TaxID=1213857 RepID=N4VPI2_COLOR|nr:Arylacetonitrilase [Colletotrichum orbiculare MAFF 240422]